MSAISAKALVERERAVLDRLAHSDSDMDEIARRSAVPLTEREAAIHLRDLRRTRITPGADPRVAWDTNSHKHQFYRRTPHEPEHYESTHEAPRSAYILMRERPSVVRNAAYGTRGHLRYVPCDVCRWRDPEHRAAMTERARVYATERVTYTRTP